jgi:predicted Rossmann fold flavoprotein
VVVIGAGAAGLMCAMRAGSGAPRAGARPRDAPGKKILISGGGRCNFTNRDIRPERFVRRNPHFAARRWPATPAADFVALVGAPPHPLSRKRRWASCSATARHARWWRCCSPNARPWASRSAWATASPGLSRAERFSVETDRGSFAAQSLVLATGGLSIPKMGATGFALDAARRFGLPVTATRAGLVPLTFGAEALEAMRPLAGVALPVRAQAGRAAFPEAMLFTHRGLSGPAILQISSYWREGEAITLDLLPGRDAAALLLAAKRERPRAELRTILAELLPTRLAQALRDGALGIRPAGRPARTASLASWRRLQAWELRPAGSRGLRQGRGDAGRRGHGGAVLPDHGGPRRAGLFVVGEAVDVSGWLGAITSSGPGRAAGPPANTPDLTRSPACLSRCAPCC